MAVLAGQVVGGLVALSGAVSLVRASRETQVNHRPAHDDRPVRERVALVVANTFRSIHSVVFALANVKMGMHMIVLAPQVGFFAAAFSAIESAIPYVAVALSSFLAARMASDVGSMYHAEARAVPPVDPQRVH